MTANESGAPRRPLASRHHATINLETIGKLSEAINGDERRGEGEERRVDMSFVRPLGHKRLMKETPHTQNRGDMKTIAFKPYKSKINIFSVNESLKLESRSWKRLCEGFMIDKQSSKREEAKWRLGVRKKLINAPLFSTTQGS